ncbi:MAG TPA: M50 family metallopeptidase, partial [Negativicutes bacterium]|nr:M50 family metallopeptidase [Negativicutes bacterium]
MRAGRVAGVQLILNNWFLALIVLFAFAGLAGKVLAVFAAVLWHEAAHAAAAAALGYRVREIELLPFGGVARIERADTAGAASEIIMAAAGPLA